MGFANGTDVGGRFAVAEIFFFAGGLGVELFGFFDLFFFDENSGAQFERHDRKVADERLCVLASGMIIYFFLVVVVFLFFFFGGVFIFHAFGDAPELRVETARGIFGLRDVVRFERLHAGCEISERFREKREIGERGRRSGSGLQHFDDARPIGGAQTRREGGDRCERWSRATTGCRAWRRFAAGVFEFGGELRGVGEAAFFHEAGDRVHEVVDVIPIVIDADVLGLHVGLVGDGRGGERFVGGGVIAGAIEDVAGHVDHMAGRGSEAAENFGAVLRLFGLGAASTA